jgi:hypothetical protein
MCQANSVIEASYVASYHSNVGSLQDFLHRNQRGAANLGHCKVGHIFHDSSDDAKCLSHLSPEEVLAMAELGCQHVTVSQDNYRQLIASPDESPATTHSKPTHPYAGLSTPERLQSLAQKDPLSAAEKNGLVASLDTDYVAQNGKILDAAIERDSVAGKRMNDAMKFFTEWEEKAKQIIEDEISKLRLT